MSGLCSAPPWMTASMRCSAKVRSISARSATDPITSVSVPGATSRPITACPFSRSIGARKRPSQPEEPVSRTRMSGRYGYRHWPGFGGLVGVLPFGATRHPGIEEQGGQLQEQQFGVDERVDPALPPFRIALAVRLEPPVIGCPVARLVLL